MTETIEEMTARLRYYVGEEIEKGIKSYIQIHGSVREKLLADQVVALTAELNALKAAQEWKPTPHQASTRGLADLLKK